MTNIIISWQDKPQQEGWYATLFYYEVEEEEGIFSSANYWNGTHWDANEPIFECAGPFESKNIAGEWAYENYPENY